MRFVVAVQDEEQTIDAQVGPVLACVELQNGSPLWRINLIAQFDGDPELVWGVCSSPLIVDDKLIINPGGPEASVVALDN